MILNAMMQCYVKMSTYVVQAWPVAKGEQKRGMSEKGVKKNRERRFCCVECACLHDACDREHHFAVENVQLHSSRAENKQASLYSSPFRKLAGAFLDHELQKLVFY